MEKVDDNILDKIYRAGEDSHKGDNGRLLIIGGSGLFHGACLWPAEVASRIVDLVFFSSTPLNNKIYDESKKVFRNGIVVPREKIDDYLSEADCVLIGPGMMRSESFDKNRLGKDDHLEDILKVDDEGLQTRLLTQYVLDKYPRMRFVIDGGALQMMNPAWLDKLATTPILTPHHREFELLLRDETEEYLGTRVDKVKKFAKDHSCIVLQKGREDIVSDGVRFEEINGGNAGMTKGGTGDVLAGIVASLYCKSPAYEAAVVASYVNKKAGEKCAERVGNYYNASDLAGSVPGVMRDLLEVDD